MSSPFHREAKQAGADCGCAESQRAVQWHAKSVSNILERELDSQPCCYEHTAGHALTLFAAFERIGTAADVGGVAVWVLVRCT